MLGIGHNGRRNIIFFKKKKRNEIRVARENLHVDGMNGVLLRRSYFPVESATISCPGGKGLVTAATART